MAKLENKTKENPKLEQNKLSDGRISLYLEYYLGREEKPVLDVYFGAQPGLEGFYEKNGCRRSLQSYIIKKDG